MHHRHAILCPAPLNIWRLFIVVRPFSLFRSRSVSVDLSFRPDSAGQTANFGHSKFMPARSHVLCSLSPPHTTPQLVACYLLALLALFSRARGLTHPYHWFYIIDRFNDQTACNAVATHTIR